MLPDQLNLRVLPRRPQRFAKIRAIRLAGEFPSRPYLSGLIPNDGTDADDLKRRLLDGRYSERRMLFFLGKDVFRWIGQCLEWSASTHDLTSVADLRSQSFAGLLTASPPEAVKDKLVRWGVSDQASIFARAIGMDAAFTEPPPVELLAEQFLHDCHPYSDYLFRRYMDWQPHCEIAR